jgi:hypothetical protein
MSQEWSVMFKEQQPKNISGDVKKIRREREALTR